MGRVQLFEIRLSHGRAVYSPGEPLAGAVRVRLGAPLSFRGGRGVASGEGGGGARTFGGAGLPEVRQFPDSGAGSAESPATLAGCRRAGRGRRPGGVGGRRGLGRGRQARLLNPSSSANPVLSA
jgi:hypothetical protein